MSVLKTVEVPQRGTYSIRYIHEEGENQEIRALDWNWMKKGEWAASARDGVRWYVDDESDEKMREVLLKHFGLTGKNEASPGEAERLKFVPPNKLAQARRSLERGQGLPRHEMKSDTLGFHIDAEEYSD